jgi:hypothetical protein
MLGVLRRRWYVVLPALLLAIGAAMMVRTVVGNQYRAQSSIVLVTPATPPDLIGEQGQRPTPCAQNPFCGSGNLSNLGNVVARSMADDDVAERIDERHPGVEYVVVLSPDDRSPIIEMTTTAAGADRALAALQTVEREVRAELQRRQRAVGVPADALITSDVVTAAKSATVQAGGRIRATVVTLGAGLLLTIGLAYLVESVSRSRRARAAATTGEGVKPGQHPAAEPVPLVAPAGRAPTAKEPRAKAAGGSAGGTSGGANRRSGRFASGRADQRRS